MLYYYNLMDGYDDPYRFYNSETIRRFRVYPATPEIEKAAKKDGSGLWPVHDPYGYSWEPVECENIEKAYEYILESENNSVYERIHDI